ncbi:hypothetical protein ACPV3O_23385 [Vibrio rotiferianus]|uniref:hypothetical protein n=1 Tax=Vibrio rotiferianus TaxID=190895 RepID=UPI00406A57BB
MEKYILLSIRPHYIREMVEGVKRYEFRKKFPNISDMGVSNKVFIYSSKPVMAIVGSFVVKKQYHSDFKTLMKDINASKAYSERISDYLIDKKSCHALEVSELIIYENYLTLNELRHEFGSFTPGQSYRYLDPRIIDKIKDINNGIL